MLTPTFYWLFCQASSGRFCITYLYQRKSGKQVRDSNIHVGINFPFLWKINKQISTNLQQCNHFRCAKKSYFTIKYCNIIRNTCRKWNTARKFLQWKHTFLGTAFSISSISIVAGHNVGMNFLYFSYGLTIFSYPLLLPPINWVRPRNYKIPERKTYLWKKGEERKPGPLWQNKSHGLSSMQIWQC